jgi:hypothetical protein
MPKVQTIHTAVRSNTFKIKSYKNKYVPEKTLRSSNPEVRKLFLDALYLFL